MTLLLEQITDCLTNQRDFIDMLPQAGQYQVGRSCRRGCDIRLGHLSIDADGIQATARQLGGGMAFGHGLHFMLELHRPDCDGLTIASMDYSLDRAWLLDDTTPPDGPLARFSTRQALVIGRESNGALFTENSGSDTTSVVGGPKETTEGALQYRRITHPEEIADIDLVLAAMRDRIISVIYEPQFAA